MNKWKPVLVRFSSLKLTLFCLALSMVLIFFGTIAQVHIGTFAAQKEFFNSFWIFKKFGSFKIPIFPGGLTVGIIWAVNLTAAFLTRYRWNRHFAGILTIHSGIMILLLGQFLTQTLAVESQMPLEIGRSANYSESSRDMELAITRNDSQLEDVSAIPEKILKREGPIAIPDRPFRIIVKKYFRNAKVSMAGGESATLANRGIGTQVSIEEMAPVSSDEEVNNVSAFIEILEGDKSLGVWLVSAGLGAPQSFFSGGQAYSLSMRLQRHYYPFTIHLKEFHHDIYAGTDIPKNFSSLIRLSDPDTGENRDALIYMNHPLRYGGLTFYQASFGKNDTLSVFQVVKNPVWLTPYISCILVITGLAIQFLGHLLQFSKKSA